MQNQLYSHQMKQSQCRSSVNINNKYNSLLAAAQRRNITEDNQNL
jgi:hypothetical protein